MPEKKTTLLFAALMLLASPLPGHTQKVDYNRSQITFISRQMNVPVEARFNRFTAQISFNAAKPETAKAAIDIDIGSFDIGNDEINAEVRKKEWFDTRNFPKATFVSSTVHALSGGRYEARGPLTIKGRTNEITAPFTVKTDAAGNSIFEGTLNIRRLQHNIGEGGIWKDTDLVADEVQIKFRLHTSGK